MHTDLVLLPPRKELEHHVLNSLARYWPKHSKLIETLPLRPCPTQTSLQVPLKLAMIKIPAWAKSWAVDGMLPVPQEIVPNDTSVENVSWRDIDWMLAIFLLLEAWHERLWEQKHGPIHSYSFHLQGWDDRVWQYAWVNRIALFLREWAAQENCSSADSLFEELPKTEIVMTHDVDAIEKTLSIRLKQSVFICLNAIRVLLQGDLNKSSLYALKAIRMFCSKDNWWKFDELLAAESKANITSVFHFYADMRPKSFKRWLFDPGYALTTPQVMGLIQHLLDNQYQIGLHPSFESWNNSDVIALQKKQLELVTNMPITTSRQHWLRFSWRETWGAQENAGLRLDRTLLFNDRPGFRNSTALSWRPWDHSRTRSYDLTAQPTILMDSHFYDYNLLNDSQRQQQIRVWINECLAVHGHAAVLWHPHTLAKVYGWSQGFHDLLWVMQQMKTE